MYPTKQEVVDRVNADILAAMEGEEYHLDWFRYGSLNHEAHQIIRNICLHGLFSKFEKPCKENAASRRYDAEQRYLSVDASLPRPSYSQDDALNALIDKLDPNSGDYAWLMSRLIVARSIACKILTGIRLDPDEAWVGPGETFVSLSGFTSALNKLYHGWTVTDAARTDFIRLIMRHRQLRRGVLGDMPKSTASKAIDLIHQRLDEKLVSVHGCRFATVPKNNLVDRSIGVEPFGNMMLQKMMGAAIRDRLLCNGGLDLNNGQSIHADMIKSDAYATIDLSDASDRLSMDLARSLLPMNVFSKIEAWRSPAIQMEPFKWVPLRKVGSMGNGFTFELETLIFLSLARSIDPYASVYGDDIICRRDAATSIMRLLSSVNLKVNTEKSFTDGLVRESCGAFYVGSVKVTRYDFRWATSLFDCVVLRNKARRISTFLRKQGVRDEVFQRISSSLTMTLSSIGVCFGPEIPEELENIPWYIDRKTSSFGLYLETDDHSLWSTPRTKRAIATRNQLAKDYQIQKKLICCILAEKWDPQIKTHFSCSKEGGPFHMAVLLKSNSLPTTYKRGGGRFRKEYFFFSHDGILLKEGLFHRDELGGDWTTDLLAPKNKWEIEKEHRFLDSRTFNLTEV